MRKLVVFAVFIIVGIATFGQKPIKYWIQFTDKSNSHYSITNPSAFLSQRSIDRRTQFNIPVDMTDLPVNTWYIDSLRALGVNILNTSKWLNAVTVHTNDTSMPALIKTFGFVKKVDTVAYSFMKSKNIFDDDDFFERIIMDKSKDAKELSPDHNKSPKKAEQTRVLHTGYNYGLGYNQIKMLNGDYLHINGFTGSGKVIAVLDGGFISVNTLSIFDSLFQNNRILGTRNFVDKNESVYTGSSHGTKVLSTMGGNLPGELVGTAPHASYWLIKSEDTDTEYPIEVDNWVSAAEFADSVGADIINSSLGYSEFDVAAMNYTYADMNGRTSRASIAATMAARKGMIIVNSAGNEGNDPWHYIAAPADADSIITVGAVDESGAYAYFSSVGPTSDGRTKPTVMAKGLGTAVANMSGGATTGNGTSYSSPVMAGMVACLWQAMDSLSNMEIISLIKKNSSLSSSPNNTMGYGIPNFMEAVLAVKPIITKIPNEQRLIVYPNPFTNQFTMFFEAGFSGNIQIELTDLTGKQMYKQRDLSCFYGYNKYEISDLNGLPKGMYVLTMRYMKEIFQFKIQKNF